MNYILSRVAFTIFNVDIYWYGLIIAGALLLAFVLALVLTKRKKVDTDIPFDILMACIPLGIVCARAFDCIFDSSLTIADFFEFRSGGMSIIGAIIGGAIGLGLLKLIKKRSILECADVLVVVLILGQGIGRWGNYFNNEVYGQLVTNPACQIFPLAVNIGGQWYQALFFYEFVLNLLGFVGLLIGYLKVKNKGIITASYLIYYGTIRTILEPMRQNQFVLRIGTAPVSLIISATMIAIGVGLLIFAILNRKKEELRYEAK